MTPCETIGGETVLRDGPFQALAGLAGHMRNQA